MKNYKFYEEYHLSEHVILESWEQGHHIETNSSNFNNHAVRLINQKNQVGFFVSTGYFDKKIYEQNSLGNCSIKVKVPCHNNNFIKQLEIDENINEGITIDLIREKLDTVTEFKNLFVSSKIKELKKVKRVSNSLGANATQKVKRIDILIDIREKDTNRLLFTGKFNANDIASLLKTAKILNNNYNTTTLNKKEEFILLTPQAVSNFLYPIQDLLINNIYIPTKLNPLINLVETNIGRYSIPFDDEGVATSIKTIFQDGLYKNIIFSDLSKGVSTGNGFRKDYRRKPNLAPLIWEIQSGSIRLQKLIQNVERIILIPDLFQTRFEKNSVNMISTVYNSFVIEHGEIKQMLRPYQIIVDPFSIFEDNDLILSKERMYTQDDRFYLPYFLTKKVKFL